MKMIKRFVQMAAGGLFPLLLVGPVSGAIISGSITATTANTLGAVFNLVGPQAVVGGNGLAPFVGKDVFGMNERTGVTLAAPLGVDGGGILAAGTKVDSHLVFVDFLQTGGLSADVLFSRKVLGVILQSNPTSLLAPTNGFLGLAGTTYLNANNWGLEKGAVFAGLTEGVTISGNSITFTAVGGGGSGDYVRVLTEVPEPGSLAILGFSAFAFVGAARLRRRKGATAA